MTEALPNTNLFKPIVYADQRQRKVFVMDEERQTIFNPDELVVEDVAGNTFAVPTVLQGAMTVLDVTQLHAGGYFLRFLRASQRQIKFILF